MPAIVDAAGPFVEFGDSITAQGNYWWPHATGGLVDQINAQFVTRPVGPNPGVATGRATATGSRGVVGNSTTPTKTLQWKINTLLTAQSGWTSADLLAQLPTALATYNPKVILMLIGINDAYDSGTPEATYEAHMTTIFDTIHAADPTTQVILLSIMAHFEQWDQITGWGPNPDDAWLAQANAFLAAEAVARPYLTFVDVRSALLAGEQINNTSPIVGTVVGVIDGIYTDTGPGPAGIHPTQLLKLLMASTTMANITVNP